MMATMAKIEPVDEFQLRHEYLPNPRDGYWLYVIYDCATPTPRFVRVRDPFGSLLAKAKGSVLISARQIIEAEKPE